MKSLLRQQIPNRPLLHRRRVGGASRRRPGGRDVGGLNPNWFAIVCSFAVPIAWGLAIKARRPFTFLVNALQPALAVFAVVPSASCGGFLTLLVALEVTPASLVRLGLACQLLVFALVVGAALGTFVAAPQVFTRLEANSGATARNRR